MPDLTIPILFLIDGLIFICAALFAHEIGLDPNTTWGRTRFFLLLLGAALVFIAVLSGYFRKRSDHFAISAIRSGSAKILFSMGHIWLIIFLLYIWFITFGNWTTWNHTTSYYDQLANAFNRGQLNIDIEPGADFLAAADPYDPSIRPAFNSEIWDMSLYKGKFYLYWGPVPAMLIAPFKLFSDKKITDNYLVFVFFAGLLIFNSLIILKLWRKFFANVPEWNVLICIPLAGLIAPVLWSINGARVYEAAIGAGQFFLVGGIFFALLALDRDGKTGKANLFLAGLFWACSVGSRAINALSIIFFVAVLVFWIVKNSSGQAAWRKFVPEISALLAPLVVGAIATCWYNWARFDSPFEFGFRYAITILDLNKQSGLIFQPGYFFLNLYSYLIQPFDLAGKFPFMYPTSMLINLYKLHSVIPPMYFAGRTVGLLFCAPFLLISLVHFYPKLRLSQEKESSGASLSGESVVYFLAGSFVLVSLSLLLFFFAQMRYLVDVISQIILLAIIGYWKIVSARQKFNTGPFKILLGVANMLILFTVCAGLLLAFSSDYDRLQTLNPVLFEKIAGFLSIQK
jgi:hypothetical protein